MSDKIEQINNPGTETDAPLELPADIGSQPGVCPADDEVQPGACPADESPAAIGDQSEELWSESLAVEKKSTDTAFLLITAALLLLILAAFGWAQSAGWRMADEVNKSVVAVYMQSRERSEIATYCQQVGSTTAGLSGALTEIGRLSAEYAPNQSDQQWTQSMEKQISAVRAEAARARLLEPPAACASTHSEYLDGLDIIEDSMILLENGLSTMDPLLIRSSHKRLEEGLDLLQEALGSLNTVNQAARSNP